MLSQFFSAHKFKDFNVFPNFFFFWFLIFEEQQSDFSSFDKSDSRGQEAISKRLSVVSRVPFTEEQLFSIFDIVPGLEYCEVQRDPYSNYGKNNIYIILKYIVFC